MNKPNARKVLIAPNYGSGWSTENPEHLDAFLFDADLIAAVEAGVPLGDEKDPTSPLGHFAMRLGDAKARLRACGLRVVEIPRGTTFRVTEYDGAEGIEYLDIRDWRVA